MKKKTKKLIYAYLIGYAIGFAMCALIHYIVWE